MLVKYVEKWTSRVTRHIESNPTLANVAPIVQMLPPPIVQPATMSPLGNFLQLGVDPIGNLRTCLFFAEVGGFLRWLGSPAKLAGSC